MAGSDVHTVDLNRSGISRIAWFIMGIFFAVVGTIGIVIPGLPTTPLMILGNLNGEVGEEELAPLDAWLINAAGDDPHPGLVLVSRARMPVGVVPQQQQAVP